MDKKDAQATVTIKKVARIDNLVLEIPSSLKNDYVQKGIKANVSYSESNEIFSIIYEIPKSNTKKEE